MAVKQLQIAFFYTLEELIGPQMEVFLSKLSSNPSLKNNHITQQSCLSLPRIILGQVGKARI